MGGDSINLPLTPIHRITMIAMIMVQYVLFVWSNILIVNYHSFKIPFLHYPSMTDASTTETHYTSNLCLYLFFWLQHIAMATLKYKISWYNHFKYFVLYDRYLFNIASALALTFCFSFA